MDRARALALTLLAATLWGTSFPANDLGLAGTDPHTFMAARFAVAFAATAALSLAVGAWSLAPLRSPWVWALGGVGALGYLAQFAGQELTTPGAASLMVNTGNLAVPLLAWLLLRERLPGAKAPALALAAAGIVLVGTRGDLAMIAGSAFLGNLLALAGGLCWAALIVLNKRAVAAHGLLPLTTWVTGLTALFALPGALLLGSGELPPAALGAVAYTGIGCTTVALLAWSAGLRSMTSTVSALVLLWEIVVALALSAALGLEVLTLPGLAGAACILGAIALAHRDAGAAPAAAAEAAGPGPAAPGAGRET